MRIPARPTYYNGIRMRSRLEASTAALLDEAGLHWKYEGPCFASRSGQYLPDFRIETEMPGRPVYLEVKPPFVLEDAGDRDDALKRMEIVLATHPRAYLALWSPESDRLAVYFGAPHGWQWIEQGGHWWLGLRTSPSSGTPWPHDTGRRQAVADFIIDNGYPMSLAEIHREFPTVPRRNLVQYLRRAAARGVLSNPVPGHYGPPESPGSE